MRFTRRLSNGTVLTILFSLLGFIISLFKFFHPESPISYTGGAELVILTTITIAIFIGVTSFFNPFSWQRFILNIFIIILILGTLFASYLLESWLVLGCMLIVLVCWLFNFFEKNG